MRKRSPVIRGMCHRTFWLFRYFHLQQLRIIMCTFATDKFGADSGSSDMGLADFVIGKADRNGNLFKVHADEGIKATGCSKVW